MQLRIFLLLFCLSWGVTEAASLPGMDLPQQKANRESGFSKWVSREGKVVSSSRSKRGLKSRLQQWVIRHFLVKPIQETDNTKKGKTVLLLGIFSLGALLIPYLNILALPLAIVTLVMGYKLLRSDPQNKNAKTGIIFAWISIALLVLIFSIVAIVLFTLL